MAPASKAVMIKRAIARIAKTERRLLEDVRLVIDGRIEKCFDDCPGWRISDHGIERCDECARLNKYERGLHDGMFALLPEAYDALRKYHGG